LEGGAWVEVLAACSQAGEPLVHFRFSFGATWLNGEHFVGTEGGESASQVGRHADLYQAPTAEVVDPAVALLRFDETAVPLLAGYPVPLVRITDMPPRQFGSDLDCPVIDLDPGKFEAVERDQDFRVVRVVGVDFVGVRYSSARVG
jgi:hypothetical protein